MRTALLLSFAASIALADVGFRQGGSSTTVPVRDIECGRDGGFTCVRDAGTAIGVIRCVGATATEPGCITPSDQSFAGNKTWSGSHKITGVTHASLAACNAGAKNTMQGCTTHGALVWCDGTSNQELLGAGADEVVLAAAYVNGIPPPYFGGVTLPAASGWTINALSGQWVAGTGTGTLRLNILSSAGECNCDVDCDTPSARNSCSGQCSPSASDSLLFLRGGSGTVACTRDPYVFGNLYLMGVAQ